MDNGQLWTMDNGGGGYRRDVTNFVANRNVLPLKHGKCLFTFLKILQLTQG
jgi:hypothetical protein